MERTSRWLNGSLAELVRKSWEGKASSSFHISTTTGPSLYSSKEVLGCFLTTATK